MPGNSNTYQHNPGSGADAFGGDGLARSHRAGILDSLFRSLSMANNPPNTSNSAMLGLLTTHLLDTGRNNLNLEQAGDAATAAAYLNAGGQSNYQTQKDNETARGGILNTMLQQEEAARKGARDIRQQRVQDYLNPTTNRQSPVAQAESMEFPRFINPNQSSTQLGGIAQNFVNPDFQALIPRARTTINALEPYDTQNINLGLMPPTSMNFNGVAVPLAGEYNSANNAIRLTRQTLVHRNPKLDYIISHELGHRYDDKASKGYSQEKEVAADKAAVKYLLKLGYSREQILSAIGNDPRPGLGDRQQRAKNELKNLKGK